MEHNKAMAPSCGECGMPLPYPAAACPACGKQRAGEGTVPCLDVVARQGEEEEPGAADEAAALLQGGLLRGASALLEAAVNPLNREKE